MQGEGVPARTAGVYAREPSTCWLDERIAEVRARSAGGCVVLFENGVVAGLLSQQALAGNDNRMAAEAMDSAPLTIRLDVSLENAAERMQKEKAETLLVTDNDGRLLGALDQATVERVFSEGDPQTRAA